jgi:hypothetical protein
MDLATNLPKERHYISFYKMGVKTGLEEKITDCRISEQNAEQSVWNKEQNKASRL